jgi:hypothetical protein
MPVTASLSSPWFSIVSFKSVFQPCVEQVLPLPLHVRRIGQAPDTSQFRRCRLFLLLQRSTSRTRLLGIDGLRLGTVQCLDLRESSHRALFAHHDSPAVGLKSPPYRIAYYDLPSAQPTGSIPSVIVSGTKTIIVADPQRADDWFDHFRVRLSLYRIEIMPMLKPYQKGVVYRCHRSLQT